MTDITDRLIEHWTKYMPQHPDYIADAIKSYIRVNPEQAERIRGLMLPLYRAAKEK